MTYYITTSGILGSTDALEHHGILKQKWGARRFQNYDGTLTEAGKIRYRKLEQRSKDAEDKYKKAVAHTPSRAMRWNDIGIYAYDKKMRKINSLHAKSERAKAEFEKFKELLGDEILNAKIDKNLPEKSKDELKAYKDGRTGASDADLEKAFKKMRNTAKTGEEVDRREDTWDRARDNGLWDLNFLEAVQNSVALEKGDTKTLLTEYAYYLADPEQYWQDRGKYLKDY